MLLTCRSATCISRLSRRTFSFRKPLSPNTRYPSPQAHFVGLRPLPRTGALNGAFFGGLYLHLG